MNKFWLPVGMALAMATSPVVAITQQDVMAAYCKGAYEAFFKLNYTRTCRQIRQCGMNGSARNSARESPCSPNQIRHRIGCGCRRPKRKALRMAVRARPLTTSTRRPASAPNAGAIPTLSKKGLDLTGWPLSNRRGVQWLDL
jgi:hypothetical protein